MSGLSPLAESHNSNSSTGVSSETCSLASVEVGDVIHVFGCSSSGSSSGTLALSDGTNTYTLIGVASDGASAGSAYEVDHWWTTASSAGSLTFMLTHASGGTMDYPAVWARQWRQSGTASLLAHDEGDTASGASSLTLTADVASLPTTAAASGLVAVENISGTLPPTALSGTLGETGWDFNSDGDDGPSDEDYGASSQLTVTETGDQSLEYGMTSGTAQFVGAMAIFGWASSSDVTVDLAGQSVASTEGTLPSAVTYEAAGLALASTLGAITATLSAGLLGQSLASAEGAPAATLTYPLDGAQIASTQGEITASTGGNVTVALAGQSLASTEGALGVSPSYALAGQSMASSEGALSMSSSAQVALGGQSVASTLGVALLTMAPSLAGQSLLSAYGAISLSYAAELGGELIASAYGTITASGGTVSLLVPDVLGWTFGNASLALLARGFTVGAPMQSRPVPRMPPGVVLAQSPAAGSEAAQGSTVTLLVNGTPPAWPGGLQ